VSAEIVYRSRGLCASALVALALGGQGCAPILPYTSGAPVPKATVSAMQPGKTTKYELLEHFGMPLSIAKKGETVLIPRGKEHSTGSSPGVGTVILARFESVSGDALFEAFSSRPIGPEHRVYYYGHSISTKRSLVMFTYIREWAETTTDELWVLVNEKNGIVEDFLYRPGTPK
jgi:hypothetical protein